MPYYIYIYIYTHTYTRCECVCMCTHVCTSDKVTQYVLPSLLILRRQDHNSSSGDPRLLCFRVKLERRTISIVTYYKTTNTLILYYFNVTMLLYYLYITVFIVYYSIICILRYCLYITVLFVYSCM